MMFFVDDTRGETEEFLYTLSLGTCCLENSTPRESRLIFHQQQTTCLKNIYIHTQTSKLPAADIASFLRALGLRFEHTQESNSYVNCFCILSPAAAACLRKYPHPDKPIKNVEGKMGCAFAKAFCNAPKNYRAPFTGGGGACAE